MKTKSGLPRIKGIVHKTFSILLVISLVLGFSFGPATSAVVYAAENPAVKLSQTGGYFAFPGDTNVKLTMKVENTGSTPITFAAKTGLTQTSGAITEPKPSTAKTTLEAGGATEILFLVEVAKTARIDDYTIPVILTDSKDGSILRSRNLELRIIKKSVSPGAEGSDNISYAPAFDLVYKLDPSDAIKSGTITKLSLSFVNSGNTIMKNAIVTLGMPEGVTINNGSSSLSVGYVNIGETKNLSFSLIAEDKVEAKNYPFTVDIEFKDYGNSTQSLKQTLYIPVQGSGTKTSLSGLTIADVRVPKQVLGGENFTLKFKVSNSGDSGTGQIKIYTEAESGIVNRTQNVFTEKNIPAGGSRNYSVDLFATDSAEETGHTIKLVVEPLSGEGNGAIQQYTSVFIKKIDRGTDSIKTPQLMVDNYNYGGTYVQAGDEFKLDLGLRNTSSGHNLRNVKVTLDSGEGTFIPVRSSNSFFIDRIGKNASVNHSIYLSVKPDAEQKTTSLSIAMSYEDTEGNEFSATDVISIPVMQDTRLLVDEIIPPPELYAGMPMGVSVDFYNMGKTKLNNLRINAEGNFDTMESNSYFAGNMEPGSSDSYDFSFTPREVGMMEGKVIFTYEDASGDQQIYEKEFEFQIVEMPNWDEGPFPDEDMPGAKSGIPWIPISIAGGIAAVGAFLLIRRHRKKKMQREMEIDE